MNPKCLTDRTNRTELSDWSNRTELELYAVGSIHISAHNAAVVTLLSPPSHSNHRCKWISRTIILPVRSVTSAAHGDQNVLVILVCIRIWPSRHGRLGNRGDWEGGRRLADDVVRNCCAWFARHHACFCCFSNSAATSEKKRHQLCTSCCVARISCWYINEYFQPRLDASRAVTNYTVVTRSLTPLDICSNPILSNIRPLEDGKTHLSKQGDKNETSVMIRWNRK